jgi:3-phosphoshikimate 1-carboxyvinyltransferase
VSDRVERLFGFAELPLRAAGGMLQLEPGAAPRAFADALPGDSSVGWALLAAALGAPDSVVGVRAMAIGPCRSGLSNALSRAGGSLHIEPKRARLGEPSADVTLRAGELGALCLEGELGLRAGAALPVACALAASATGHSRLADIATSVEQRQRTLSMLDAYGVRAASWGNGIELWGSFDRPRAAELDCRGDAALAMAATVLGLRAAGPCRIRGADCIVESAPRFVGSLRALGANIDVLPAGRPA